MVAVALLAGAVPLQAAPQALLVGVSGYPSLPEARRLRGPRNDVPLMRDALLRAGMSAAGVTLLADGVPGSRALPTRQAILSAMADLAARATPGDWVVVYFSGHGSQQPQPRLPAGSGAHREPDGLDEIFLPYDIGDWDGRAGGVRGALVDDEIGAALAAITARGARVWAIFDTCHAGDMARSWQGAAPGVSHRNVPPDALGVPATAGALPSPRRTPTAPPGGAVVFYAAQPDEPALEEPLPEAGAAGAPGSGAQRRVHGYFTWLIAQALAQQGGAARDPAQPGTTLAALARRVAQGYASRPFPTPLFEGNLAQVPNFFSGRGLTNGAAPVPGIQASPRATTSRTP